MPTSFDTLEETAQQMIDCISKECIAQVLSQFQNLLNAGILTVKEQKPTISLLRNPTNGKVELSATSAVTLGFRGEEEIARLKEENAKLDAKLRTISQAIKEIPHG